MKIYRCLEVFRFVRIARPLLFLPLLLRCGVLTAQTAPSPLAKYIKVPAGTVLLNHVRVIDGTGAAPLQDQAVLLEAGKIACIA